MSERIKAAQADQLVPGQSKLIRVKGHEIALFNLEGSYYAITNICPHSTGPLVEGRVSGTMVTCPWHGAQFDITSGQCLGGPATRDIVVYEVRVEGNDIYLTIS